VLNRALIDEVIAVSDERAVEVALLAAKREGILAGISSGAALAAALELAARPEAAGWRIVVILPDSGERYISLPYFAR
jgi:cysteine synthase A